MGAGEPLVVPLVSARAYGSSLVGSKALNIGRVMNAGFNVPRGFCVTTTVYKRFLEHGKLGAFIAMELGRKPLQEMRWEEIWDTALRIRSAFLSVPVPAALCTELAAALAEYDPKGLFAVRSSAPGEDSAAGSFAGLHESQVGVTGLGGVLEALPLIWASLWSDAALLYRRELQLDPTRSCMAVIIQEMVDRTPSGVAFARDPRRPCADQALVEAVPGLCADLVDGTIEPDRWTVNNATGEIHEWLPGVRESDSSSEAPLLDDGELRTVLRTLAGLEKLLNWPPDMEWTGRGEELTVLQARPITTLASQGGQERSWYLTLRPARRRLSRLCRRVAEELIPQLEALGGALATQALDDLDDQALAKVIDERLEAVNEWKRVYKDEFIPFAHGVRQLGLYYNDVVKPHDPYEFVGLLSNEEMLATRRNRALGELALAVREDTSIEKALVATVESGSTHASVWRNLKRELDQTPSGEEFFSAFQNVVTTYMDVTYQDSRLNERPELVLRTVLEMSRKASTSHEESVNSSVSARDELERRLLEAAGALRRDEAEEVLRVGRISWRLRDDDNLLVARLDSQLVRALELAAARLRRANQLRGERPPTPDDARQLAAALREPASTATLSRPASSDADNSENADGVGAPRQLTGQPASPGLASGRARSIRSADDLSRFLAGEILVCDAIQPNMTQLVPLASAIVERRGGMLIHGAIIARELGIPCVNGVRDAVDVLQDGQLVSVDGNLGIVTVGPPDFDVEFAMDYGVSTT